MAVQNAVDYFQSLSQCLLETQITSMDGVQIPLEEGMEQTIELILKTGFEGKIMVIGNGGSAAIASHVHNDLCKVVGAKAMVLSETALLTALTNDLGYAEAYEKQVQMWATAQDLLIAISSSGKSENILRSVRAAKACQCAVVTFSGFLPENPLRQMGAVNFFISSNHYGFVEMSHAVQLHYLTDTAGAIRKTIPTQALTPPIHPSIKE